MELASESAWRETRNQIGRASAAQQNQRGQHDGFKMANDWARRGWQGVGGPPASIPAMLCYGPSCPDGRRSYPLDKGPIILGNFKKRRDRFAKKFNLTHDVLRHTFISMFVAKFRSIGEAAIQAGNSEAIIRKHYLDLKTTKEADAFFGIMPKHVKVFAAPSAATPANAA